MNWESRKEDVHIKQQRPACDRTGGGVVIVPVVFGLKTEIFDSSKVESTGACNMDPTPPHPKIPKISHILALFGPILDWLDLLRYLSFFYIF